MRKSRKYRKIVKEYRKKMRENLKLSAKTPFNNEMGLEMFMEYIKFMLSYYKLNENVSSSDDIPGSTIGRIESLTETIKAYENYVACEEKYMTLDGDSVVCKYPDDYERTMTEWADEVNYWWNRLWELICKYYNHWWD